MRIFYKVAKVLIVFIIIILFFTFLLSRGHVFDPSEIEYGVTFSSKQASDLGLDWRGVFSDMFENLGVKRVRLSAYWNEVEPRQGDWNFTDIDWQVNTASVNDAKVVLAVGARLPRWPECHIPEWAKNATAEAREKAVLSYIEQVVYRYKYNKNIIAWQVENEPFLAYFGECPPLDKDLLDKEIELVRRLDSRPVVLTDSGELSFWVPAAKRADIFGTTMYRDTYSKKLNKYVHYPITPAFFRFKRNLASIFAHPKEWIVIELQAEPWASQQFQDVSAQERAKTMDAQKLKDMIAFSRDTGFKTFYLWGVEWWYWEKEKQNNPEVLNYAQTLFR